MNILHINTMVYGGAASGAYRLHEALKRLGHNSKIIVQEGSNDDEDIIVVGLSEAEKEQRQKERLFLKTLKAETDLGFCYFNPMPFFYNFNEQIMSKIPFEPDLLIVHWTTWFADVETFSLISKKYNIPVIWYMSDMEPMTGGCHYNFECDNYCSGCRECLAFDKYIHSVAKRYFSKKQKYISEMDIKIVASSTYMLTNAKKSLLFKDKPMKMILRGIDDKVFYPVSSKKELRKEWELKEDDIVLFFGAYSIQEARKGMCFLLEGLNILSERLKICPELKKRVKVIYAGSKGIKDDVIPFKNIYAGFMRTQQSLAAMYQLADVFVCPTMQDSGPMMVSESLMCGTPVVGFKMGVLPDVVHDGKTGYLADLGDSDGLAVGLERLLKMSKEERVKMSAYCAKYAKELLSYKRQGEAVISFGLA